MRIYLSLPSYDQRHWAGTMMSVFHCRAGLDHSVDVYPDPIHGSVQPRLFNQALAKASINKFDVLAMLHADIAVEACWLSHMWDMMQDYDADVLSAVVPLKDDSDLTSTGIATATNPYYPLSQGEVELCPSTFDVEAPALQQMGAKQLLLNTGVMLMRLDRPWLKQWSGFQFRSGIDWQADGGATVNTVSEDWDMSEALAKLSDPPLQMATRAVRVQHFGDQVWDG